MRKFGAKIALAACLAGATLASAKSARAVIVERIVAVIGDRPILLSELRRREHPFLFRIIATSQNQAQVAAAKSEMEKQLLDRMIEERLVENAADKAHLSVTAEEIDGALRNVANSAHITVPQLIEEAEKQGLSEIDYREELQRQVLKGKLEQLRVRGRVRVTDQDARTAYQRFVGELEKENPIELRILARRIPAGSNVNQVAAITRQANWLVNEARKPGADFCALIVKYSEDTQTKKTCGSRGPQPMDSLRPELQAAVAGLKVGDVTEPIAEGTDAVLIVQVGPNKTPAFDEVKDQMWEKAYVDVMDRQWKQWLDEMRRSIYVEPRL
jgi:peptidyl-prolyl cis-trans isomerase SurA